MTDDDNRNSRMQTHSAQTNYAGLETVVSPHQSHLGGNILIGDPFTYCPTVWDYVISRFCIESVLDVGSGVGHASHYFFQRGVKTVAVDGLEANIRNAIYPSVLADLTKGPVTCPVDLVHCQEVVEHIDEKFLENIIRTLLNGQIILLTHALPAQQGYHHVNCQNPEYWISHLKGRGCAYLEADTLRVRELAARDGAAYMQATGLLFANNTRY